MAQSSTQSTLASGAVLHRRYRIEQMIGSGGYASVYRAVDLQSGQEYAVKEVVDPDPAVRKQFQIEAELLIHAPHHNIPQGYDYFDEKGRMYLVMEYVRGKDLEERLNDSLVHQGKPLDEAQVLNWMIQICDALIEMHNQPVPIIHRDIKPANIKITPDGRPVLIDFGLAKQQRAGNPTMTAAQGVSPGFAPPEQYMAKGKTDARTDVYALGATLYACLTGKDPAEAPARLLAQTGTRSGGGATLQAARKLNPRISEPTDRLITRSLELSPMHRQQTARSMRTELRAALAALTGGATSSLRSVSGESGKRAAVGANGSAGASNPRGSGNGKDGKARGAGGAAAGATGMHPAPPIGPAESWPGQGSANGRSGKQVAVGAGRPAKQPAAVAATPRTGKQPVAPGGRTAQHAVAQAPALQLPMQSPSQVHPGTGQTGQMAAPGLGQGLGRRAGQQPVMMEQRTNGRQPVVPPRMDGRMDVNAGGYAAQSVGALAIAPGTMGAHTAVAVAAPGTRSGGRRAVRERTTGSRPWIWLGDEELNAFGKWMLALACIEVLWGASILTLGGIVIATPGRPLPYQQLGIAGAVVLLLVSVIGGQALSRPVFRRGIQTKLRRGLQGSGLVVYTIVVHGVALWGATIFATTQNNTMLATIAFLLFGVNVLVVGILSVVNALS